MVSELSPANGTVPLSELVEHARTLVGTGRRRFLGITGTPGSGKSTLSAALVDELGDSVRLVEMDGFHLANAELARLGRRDRKGAPDTFDVDGYVALLDRLATAKATVYAPRFDRSLEESIGSAVAIPADIDLIITEGNYLLHDDLGWQDVAARLDEAWFVDVSTEERRARLTARREGHGHPSAAAAAWVRDVDEPNAVIIERARVRADKVVRVTFPPVTAPRRSP